MTKRELNAKIRKLYRDYIRIANSETSTEYYAKIKPIKERLKNLYWIDRTGEYLTADSLRILIGLNCKLRVIPLHHVGMYYID